LSPAASYEIGQYFKGKDAEGSAGHIFAHTILGAAVAAAGGNDALTAGLSVGGAEAVAPILSEYLYGKKPSDLTAEEKNTISTITGLVASGIGATTGDIGSTVQSGQLAQNAVENNVFGVIDKNGNLVKGANNKTKQKLDACTNSTCVSNVLMENAKDAMVGAPLEVILDHSKYKDGDIISGIHSGSGLQYLVVNENGVLKAKLLPVEYQTIYSIYQLERSQSIVGGSALAAPLATLVVGLHDSVTGNSLFTNEELSKIDRAFAAMDAAGGFGVITGAFLPGRVGSTSNSKQSIDNNFYRDDNLFSESAGWNTQLKKLDSQAEMISTAKANQATKPRDLKEQIVWNEIIENPGVGRPLDGMNYNPITGKSDPRFPGNYGFQKMEVTQKLDNGQSITIHYQYNKYTNKAYDMKITTPRLKPSWSK